MQSVNTTTRGVCVCFCVCVCVAEFHLLCDSEHERRLFEIALKRPEEETRVRSSYLLSSWVGILDNRQSTLNLGIRGKSLQMQQNDLIVC